MFVSVGAQIDPEEFKGLIEQFADIFGDTKEQKNILDKLPSFKSLSRQNIIQKISSYQEKGKLVFVLGAGVSMSYGLPNWDVLLQKLMINTIENKQNVSTVLAKLFSSIFSPSPLIAGRYLQRSYKENEFEEAVREALYENLNIDEPSTLMDEIVNYCTGPKAARNLDSIITYNFDDILERRLSKVKAPPIPFKPIFGIGVNPDNALPIYHVHGYLPHNGKLSDNNQITFGESIYHKQYIDIYSWNNIVQINKFRESNCIFIGSSLTDPNMRRLLDIAKQQKGDKNEPHFVFKMKYKEEAIKKRLESILEQNQEILDEKVRAKMNFDDTVKFLIKIIRRFEETDTSSLGVKTIWIDDWSEIPVLLKEARMFKKENSI